MPTVQPTRILISFQRHRSIILNPTAHRLRHRIARHLDLEQWETYRPWLEKFNTKELEILTTCFPTLQPGWISFLRQLEDRELEAIFCAEFAIGYLESHPGRSTELKLRLQQVAAPCSVPELADQGKGSKRCRSDSDYNLSPLTAGITPSIAERQPKRVATDSTTARCPQLSADMSANVQDQNSGLLMERPQNNITIASLVHLPTSSDNRTLEDADAPVPLKSTADGWALVFEQFNYVHDLKSCLIFNVPDIPDEAPRPESQLEADDIGNLHTEGFSHWKDDSAAGEIERLRESYFWSPAGLHHLWSALANARLQKTIHKWFKSNPSIWHCTWNKQSITPCIFHVPGLPASA